MDEIYVFNRKITNWSVGQFCPRRRRYVVFPWLNTRIKKGSRIVIVELKLTKKIDVTLVSPAVAYTTLDY